MFNVVWGTWKKVFLLFTTKYCDCVFCDIALWNFIEL